MQTQTHPTGPGAENMEPPTLPPGLRPLPAAPGRPVQTRDDDGLVVGWLIKRTYDFDERGQCRLADEQRDVRTSFLTYDEAVTGEPPPIEADDDTLCFRPGTDLVVQGSAHARAEGQTKSGIRVETDGLLRDLVVHGDRRIVWERGRLRFTDPEPFTTIPVRYDRAYGGHDRGSARTLGDPVRAFLDLINPELAEETTRWHYPRNPSGSGFVLTGHEQAANGMRAPNIEFPFDPLTPERLICPAMGAWPSAPLPAGLDWLHPMWFPRSAYLGVVPPFDTERGRFPEIEAGWAPRDLLAHTPPTELPFKAPPAALSNGASPGMTLSTLKPDARVSVTGMSLGGATRVIQLPGEVPLGTLQVPGLMPIELRPHLNSVLLDMENGQVAMTWCLTGRGTVSLETLPYQDARCPIEWRAVTKRRTQRWWGGGR